MGTNDIESLLGRFPLERAWQKPELFKESITIEGVELQLCGFSTKHEDGQEMFASAAEIGGQLPIERAYFELLERTATFQAMVGEKTEFKSIPLEGEKVKTISKALLFPLSEDEQTWRYAKSNGIAAHWDATRACQSALQEVVERDRLLRSWNGAVEPKSEKLLVVPDKWKDLYSFFAYTLPATPYCPEPNMVVALTIGFPVDTKHPLIYGFGARPDLDAALQGAWRECVQRLGFLWGEEIPKHAPEFSPSPDYHQEYFLFPSNHQILKDWLSKKWKRNDDIEIKTAEQKTVYVDITPDALSESVYIVKALDERAVPLYFGRRRGFYGRELKGDEVIHPIA